MPQRRLGRQSPPDRSRVRCVNRGVGVPQGRQAFVVKSCALHGPGDSGTHEAEQQEGGQGLGGQSDVGLLNRAVTGGPPNCGLARHWTNVTRSARVRSGELLAGGCRPGRRTILPACVRQWALAARRRHHGLRERRRHAGSSRRSLGGWPLGQIVCRGALRGGEIA